MGGSHVIDSGEGNMGTEMIPTGAPNLNLVKQNDREKLLITIGREKQKIVQRKLKAKEIVIATKEQKIEENFRKSFLVLSNHYGHLSKSRIEKLPQGQLQELSHFLIRKAWHGLFLETGVEIAPYISLSLGTVFGLMILFSATGPLLPLFGAIGMMVAGAGLGCIVEHIIDKKYPRRYRLPTFIKSFRYLWHRKKYFPRLLNHIKESKNSA